MLNDRLSRYAAASALCLAFASVSANAQLANYAQDFELLDPSSPTALSDDGWLVGANIFDSSGGFLYNYFAFPAPNGGPGFSAVATNNPAADAQSMSVYSNYDDSQHASGNLVNAVVFQEMTIDAADLDKTVSFSFRAGPASYGATGADPIGPNASSLAFLKTIDPSNGFATTLVDSVDTTVLAGPIDYSLSIFLDSNVINAGQVLQFGFESTATNFEATGRHYDNINVVVPEPSSLALIGLGAVALMRRRRYS